MCLNGTYLIMGIFMCNEYRKYFTQYVCVCVCVVLHVCGLVEGGNHSLID